MARSNPFSKKENKDKIKFDSHLAVSTQEAADGLPVVETPNSNVAIKLEDHKGNPLILILDTETKINPYKLSIKNKKGKTYLAWFHDLFHVSQTNAMHLVRIYIYLRTTEGSAGVKMLAMNILAKYLIKTKKPLSKLTYSEFSNICLLVGEQGHESTSFGVTTNVLKRIVGLIPTIPESLKKQIKNYTLPKSFNTEVVKTAQERIKESKINNDYSDYVMFQIYAYINACLLEIKETHERLLDLLKDSKLPALFSKEGIGYYKELIKSGTNDDFEKAFNMELLAHHQLKQANYCLYSEVNKGWDIEPIISILTQFKYNEAFKSLPVSLQKNKDVEYLFLGALSQCVKQDKMIAQLLIKALATNKAISIHNILSNRIRSSYVKWNLFKRFLVSQSILYQTFYGNRNDSKIPITIPFYELVLCSTSHFDFLVINLLLCETGKNKEVAKNLSAFVNLGLHSTSVLDVEAPFASEPSCWLSSFKTRGHMNGGGMQEEDMILPMSTPLFGYLKLLDSIRQQSHPDRNLFFQIDKHTFDNYSQYFSTQCQIIKENGEMLSGLETKKFRKVWTGEVLLEYLDGIKNRDDLIKAIGEDLRNTIPLTYLLQSSKTETMLASAIVGLQMRFIDHHMNLAAQIKLQGEKPTGKREKRFFCDCSDPYNPDYSADLHVEYCRQFDMCLGCSKAVVYEEHLPNIIYRCFQYEDALSRNRDLYMAQYETKHQRAIQAIERFKSKAVNGEAKHAVAFKQAASAWGDPNQHFLPPLIHPNINF
jgi:hypothetical protein